MNKKPVFVVNKRSSKVATVILFLALIRCIAEPFRLQYYSATPLTFIEIRPFLLGALTAAIAVFLVSILYYYSMHKAIIGIGMLAIVALLIIKWVCLTGV